MSIQRSRPLLFVLSFLAFAALLVAAMVVRGQLTLPASLQRLIPGAAPSDATGSDLFSKSATDRNGGALNEGDIIDYVLSYAPSIGQLTVTDRLSGNQAYVLGSLQAPDWSANPIPPYSVANTTTYTTASTGSAFVATVPTAMGLNGQSTVGGDGTIPIPIKDRVYAIFHHQSYGSAKIMCWNLYSLQPCDASPGNGAWPRSLDNPSDPTDKRATVMLAHHVVLGSKLYYASARHDSGTNVTTLGVGCWDTVTESPCPFLPVPATYAGGTFDDLAASAGVAGISDLSAIPAVTRVYLEAKDHVYCVDVTTGNICWTSAALGASGAPGMKDIMVETATSPSVLYVSIPDSAGAKVACLELASGAHCSGWGSSKTVPISPVTITPLLNVSGTVTTGVCVHEFDPILYTSATPARCLSATSGASIANPGIPSKSFVSAFPMPTPNKQRVLYPQFDASIGPSCYDFASNAMCGANLVPGWPTTALKPIDYGYASDPAHPQNCLLGLGHEGILWRFRMDGKLHDPVTDPDVCQFPVTYTFDIDDRFCAQKPQQAVWKSVSIVGRPPELTGGTIKIFDSAGTLLQTITVTSASQFTLNLPATGASRVISVEFQPNYAVGQKPANDYKLVISFSAEINPQICYSTVVRGCGEVSNEATLYDARSNATYRASTQLGQVTGGSCKAQGVVKVCKVAGDGVQTGTEFTFSDGTNAVAVPAGPAPGGYCKILGEYAESSTITVTETGPPGYTVSSINVPGAADLAPDLLAGSVTVQVGAGVTEIIFTNEKKTGFLEICKSADVRGYFRFEVSGLRDPVTVPAGACSPPLEVPAGQVIITELETERARLRACSTFPADRLVRCDPASNRMVVDVVRGGISTQTIAHVTNAPTGGETTSLFIEKLYTHPTSGPIQTYPSGVTFPLSVDCHDPTNPSGAHLQTNAALVSPNVGPISISGIPVGWSCTVTEAENSQPDANGCYWSPEAVLTPHPVTTLAAPRQTYVGLKNNYICKGNPLFDLDIINFEIPEPGKDGHGYWPCGKGEKAFRIVAQNTGNNAIAAPVLNTLTITDTKQPNATIITGFGNTDTSKWSCSGAGSASATCTFVGASALPNQELSSFATLAAVEVCVRPGEGSPRKNCATLATTPADNDVSNNGWCTNY